MQPTVRRYWQDDYERTCSTTIVADHDGWWALAETVFYPGGGGQPPDTGEIAAAGTTYAVLDAHKDDDHIIWHRVESSLPVGTEVRCEIDWSRRYALMRHHTLMHIVNTIASREYGGLITGVQIGAKHSRIDLDLQGFNRKQLSQFETSVNEAISRDLLIGSREIGHDEFNARPTLIRTLNVRPPVENGHVRIVEIGEFDAQACGGTHVHATKEIGSTSIEEYANKGSRNKRFYWVLGEP